MNRLKYPQKFALISGVFILPLSLTMYLLLSEIQSRNDFTEKEMFGNAYLRPLRQLWADIPRLQLLINSSSNQNKNEINQIKSQIAASLQYLETVEQKFGKILQTTEKFNTLKQNLQKLQENQDSWSFDKNTEYNRLSQQVDELRDYVGDQSNLILDPDLDTYYLMYTTVVELPDIQGNLAEIKLIAQKVINNQPLTTLEITQLVVLVADVKEYKDRLTKNMKVAFSNNPVGNLRPKLTNTISAFTKELEQLGNLPTSLVNTNDITKANDLFTKADRTLKQSFILWDQSIEQEDLLLQYRINGFMQKQVFLFSLGLIILAIVVYLFIGFYLGVMQTVSNLSEASKRMIDGTTDTITLDNKDELAEVVISFNNISGALVKANKEVTLLNEYLKSDNIRMSAELDVTRRLQQMILPKEQELAQIPNLDIAGYMQTATEIGGDYYDVIHRNGQVKIGIGDVTGHGLESGVLMIMVQTAIRTLIENNETDPKKFLSVLNRTIYGNVQRMNSDKNMTLSLLDYRDGVLQVSGQHEEMIIVRKGGEVEKIDTTDLGFPIGLEADIADFISYTDVELHPGDVVVLYTDGITEAEDINGVLYGLERLTEVVKLNARRTAHQIRHAVINDLRQHIGQQKVLDDFTLVVLKQKAVAYQSNNS